MNWKWLKSSVSGNFVKAERQKGSHSNPHNESLKAFDMKLKEKYLKLEEKYQKLEEKHMKIEEKCMKLEEKYMKLQEKYLKLEENKALLRKYVKHRNKKKHR